MFVGSGEASNHLLDQVQSLLRRDGTLLAEALGEGLAREQFHGEKPYGLARVPHVTEDFIDPADIDMRDAASLADLLLEAIDDPGEGGDLGANGLDSDPLV